MSDASDSIDNRPTRVRHAVVLSAMAMSVLLYLDRFCVSFAEPYIKQSLNLSSFQMGFFFSAFFLTYALAQVPAGWLTDRFGSRSMLTIYVLAWSLFTGLHGAATGFVMLICVRALCGLGQAGAYPTGANIVSKWVPFSNRGTASSIVALGGRIGGALAPPLTGLLIIAFVPLSAPSQIEQVDLLDVPVLCSQLAPGGEQSAGVARAWSRPPDDVQQSVTKIAGKHRQVADAIAEFEKQGKKHQGKWQFFAAGEQFEQADTMRIRVPVNEVDAIATALNGIIDDESFFDATVFEGIQFDLAGTAFRTQVGNGESLSPEESSRLNRLTLEKLFPGGIGDVYVSGWRPVMVSYGLIGIGVAMLLWIVMRNRPDVHPWCNSAERRLIAADRPAEATSTDGQVGSVPWSSLLRSRSMWLNCISQVGTNIGWVFLVTWFPRYLIEVHSVPIEERAMMAMVPIVVGSVGMLCGGQLTDRLVGIVGLRWGRSLPWSLSRFFGVAAFLACPFLDSPWAVTAALGIVAFSTDIGTSAVWAFCQDVGGRYVGSVLGWGNMWGNLGATISPILLAWVFESYGWTDMFYVCAASFVVSGVCALGVNAAIPIAPEEA